MDSELIIKNEAKNDGTQIYAYKNRETDTWSAYGYSAYSLRLNIKARGLDNLRMFSTTIGMPCTMISDLTVKKLQSSGIVVDVTGNDSVVLSNSISFEVEDYTHWSNKLVEEYSNKTMWVETPVSQFVPKNGYIKDDMSSFSRKLKRGIDLLASAITLIIFSPLILICYIAIKLDDGGPAIFKQERIGRFGKPFNIYKFRSMRLDAEKMGPQLSASGGEGDPRLTKVGAFLRAHHLDELPQLWNVFTGDMAFVGPRPERLFFIDQILEYDKRYTYLYQVRPGVTSYATLYNGYTDTMEKMLRRLEYDLYYLNHRSLWFDFSILFKTFCKIIFGKVF